jgi:tetratricopeptide (TPR) repeat protein
MQRFASLVAFFYLLSLVAYIKFRLTAEDIEQRAKGIVLFYIISFFSAILAMKTKENAFTLPIVITLYEFCFFSVPLPRASASPHLRVTLSKRLLYLVPILLTLAIVPLTLMVQGGAHALDPRALDQKVFSRQDYFFTQFRVIVTYLRLLFLPVNQNFDYDYPVFKSFFDPQIILSFLFLSALFGLGVYLVKQAKVEEEVEEEVKENKTLPIPQPAFRLMGFGILWFFITLSVESSIIPLWMLINEYRMYLPSVGAIICIVTGAFLLKEKLLSPKAGSIIVAMLVLSVSILSVATYLRNDLWTDKVKLWEDTAKKSPGNARVLGNLGYAYQSLNMPDKAMEQYLVAIKINPDFAQTHYNLAIVYRILNMPDKAMEQYLIAIKVKPDYAEAYNNLGGIYQDFNMPDRAVEQYLLAVKVKPDFAEAYFNLGLLYFNMGQLENARRELISGLNIKPDDQKAQQLLQMISL